MQHSSKPVIGPEESIQFLFEISKVVKLFYETPVIFFTNKDYSEYVFNTMCELRLCLQTDNRSNLMDIILDFHLQWLHAVNDIENFMKLIKDLTKDEISQAISFTIDAMALRLKYYEQYMNVERQALKNDIQANIMSDIEIVEEMHEHVIHIILEKLKCFRNYEMQYEFNLKLNSSIDDFLYWLDKIYDSLAMLLCNYINFNVPHLSGDLTKTLQQIVGDMKNSKSLSAQKLLEQIQKQDKELSSMIRSRTCHSLEICKVLDKINVIEDRINRLENQPLSAAVMALKHKKDYLEKRLSSLENMKVTLKDIEDATEDHLKSKQHDDTCICEDFFQLRIFNHQLPTEERERLVTELCYLWDLAIFGDRSHKSIISILSVADMKEEFTDELGNFIIDEHSRKIYKLPDDETKYQPNENNELVPLTDDSEHVYYYDECGRYFIDANTRQRVYKALDTSSEYMMSSAGVLLKIKEVREGVTYYYDNYGRYYINNEGRNVYKDVDAQSEYENDGFGNLVRIRSQTCLYNVCPDDENVTEDFTYLKQNVGKALRQCIAQVILKQPADPVQFLSESLIKYRENIELREKRVREKEEMAIEKENIMLEERAKQEAAARAAAQFDTGGSEASYDSNLQNYTPLRPEDLDSVDTTTK